MRRIALIMLLLMPLLCSAQKKQGQARLDSLLAEVQKMKEDMNGVKLLDAIARATNDSNRARQALMLSQKILWREGEAISYATLGITKLSENNYKDALDAFKKALSIDESLRNASGIIYDAQWAGYMSWFLHDNSAAIKYLLKAADLAKQVGNKFRAGYALGTIGQIYYQIATDTALHVSNELIPASHAANLKKSITYLNESALLNEDGFILFDRTLLDALGQLKGSRCFSF